MHYKWYPHCPRFAMRTLWNAAALLGIGLGAWEWATAEDSAAASPCANGIAVPEPQDHPGLVADCEVLLTVRARLTGESYLNWNTDVPIDQWTGISVSDSGVTKLNLRATRLKDAIPSELGRLKDLVRLDLSLNNLTGSIPAELGQLSKLLELLLSYNELTGPIPPELGQLRGLNRLYLDNNGLTGTVPAELGQLSKLLELLLSGNELTGTVPPELGKLTTVRLELSGNGFVCAPESVARRVTDLDFPVCGRRPVVEPKEGKIYWTDMSAGDILRANLDGSNVEVILEGGLKGPESIALDLAAGKMYWTDWSGDSGKIQRSDLDGSDSETLVMGLNRPGEIALDVAAGKMYYTDATYSVVRFLESFFIGRVMRADLDGSDAETILSTTLSTMEFVEGIPFWDILPPYQDIALDLGEGKVYWAGGSGIGRADLDGSNIETILPGRFGMRGPESIALDTFAGKMYWTEWGEEDPTYGIHRADLDGSNVETLAVFPDAQRPADRRWLEEGHWNAPEPTSIALDVADGKMYWTDSSRAIHRANLDGSQAEPHITVGGDPWGIALDIPGNRIYWTEFGARRVQRSDLDGTDVEVLIAGQGTGNQGIPAGLALDGVGEKIYWTDWGAQLIRRADLDGANIEDLARGLSTPAGLALDVVAGKMYWTNLDTSVIQRADLDGSNVEDLLTVPDIRDVRDIAPDLGDSSRHRVGMGGIALDPVEGRMYWTDWQTVKTGWVFSSQYEVRGANLDGTDVEVLRRNVVGSASSDLPRRVGIALDLVGGKMYWTHESASGSNTDDDQWTMLHRSNLDGSDVEDLGTSMGASDIVAVDLVGDKLYWFFREKDRHRYFGRSSIQRSNLYGNSQESLVQSGPNIGGIALDIPRPVTTLVSTHGTAPPVPVLSGLSPNYPNPFNAGTLIPYRLAAPGPVRLEIYNVLGQPVRTLVDDLQVAGSYRIFWDARDQRRLAVAAGVYLARLQYPGGAQTRRLLLLK